MRKWTSPSIVDNSGLLLSLGESHMSSHRYTPEFKDEALCANVGETPF